MIAVIASNDPDRETSGAIPVRIPLCRRPAKPVQAAGGSLLDFVPCPRQRSAMVDVDHDLILAGGGLASGLVALAFRRMRPDLDVAVVERGETIGGNHIWSFFDSDIEPAHRSLVDPLIAHRRSAEHTSELQSLMRPPSTGIRLAKKIIRRI